MAQLWSSEDLEVELIVTYRPSLLPNDPPAEPSVFEILWYRTELEISSNYRPNHHPNYHPNSLTSCRVKKITIRKWDFVIILLSCSRFMNRVQKIRNELIKIKNSNSFRFYRWEHENSCWNSAFFKKSAKSHKW